MAEFWEHLITTALLGTDKQTLEENLFPEFIQKRIQQADKKDKEAFFYTVATLSQQYRKAGAIPAQLDLLTIQTAEAEEKPYLPAQAASMLKNILTQEGEHPTLVERWLDGCIRKNWVATPNLVVTLLNLGIRTAFKPLQKKIQTVAGNRGKWMVQFNENWNYLTSIDYQQQWEDGTKSQREEALHYLRSINPDLAREWLETSWKDESAKDKLNFIAVLATNLTAADEGFLQKVWDEIQTARQKKKDIYADLLQQTTRLLLRLPDSKLSQMIWEKTKRYIQKVSVKKWMGLHSVETIALSLPATEDDFLSKEMFWYTLGLQERSSNELYTDIEGWLYASISYIPPNRWQEYLEATPAEVVSLFNTHESFIKDQKGSKIALYTIALASAAELHTQTEWAKAWVDYFKNHYQMQNNDVSYLYKYLNNEELERFYEAHIDISGSAKDSFVLRDILTNRQATHQWSLPFTQFIFKSLSKNMYYQTQDLSFISRAIGQIHPDILQEDLTAYVPETINEWQKKQWQDRILATFQQLMYIRLEMDTIFASN